MFKVSCPSCDQILKSAKEIPEGARLKCSGCGKTFTVSGDSGEVKSGPPRTSPKRPPSSGSPFENLDSGEQAADFEPVRKPAKRKKAAETAFDDLEQSDADDEPVRKSSKGAKKKPAFVPVDDDEDDEPISRPGRGRNIKKPARKSSTLKWLLIGGGGLAAVAAIVVVILLVLKGGGGSLTAEQKALIPENPSMVLGFDVRNFRNGRDYKTIKKEWAGRMPDLPFNDMEQEAPEAPELFNSLNNVMFSSSDAAGGRRAAPGGGPGKVVIVMAFSKDVCAMLKKASKSVETKAKNGTTVYEAKDKSRYVCHGNLVIILPTEPDAEAVAAYVASKTRKLPADLGAEIDRVSSNGFWLVAPVPPGMGNMAGGGPMAGMAPMMGEALSVADKVRVGSIAVDDVSLSRPVNVSANALLDNSANAAKLRKGVEDAWKTFSPMLGGGGMPMAMPLPKGFNGLVQDAQKSLAFDSSGNRATASIRLSEATVHELMNSAKDMGRMR